jgi:hypothetical protein
VGRIINSATSAVVVRGDGLALTFATKFKITTLATTLTAIVFVVSKIHALPHVGSEWPSRGKDGTTCRPSRKTKHLGTIVSTITTVVNGIDISTSIQTVARVEIIIAAKLVRCALVTTTTVSFGVYDVVTTNGIGGRFVAAERVNYKR